MTNLPSPSSQQPVTGVCTGSLPGVACWPRPANRRKVSDGASTPTGSAWPHPSSSGCPARSWRLRVCRREEPDGCLRGKRRPGRSPPWRGGCSSSMRPSARQPSRRSSERRRRARGAKSWPSGMSRRTAAGGDGGLAGVGQRPPGASRGSMCVVTPSRCGWCRSVSMSFPAARWRPNAHRGAPASPTPDVVRPVLVTVGRGGSAAGEARPVSTGVQLIGDGTATAGGRREPACGR